MWRRTRATSRPRCWPTSAAVRGGRPLRAASDHGETPELIAAKVAAALRWGMEPGPVRRGGPGRATRNRCPLVLDDLDACLAGVAPAASGGRGRLRAGLGDRRRGGRLPRGRSVPSTARSRSGSPTGRGRPPRDPLRWQRGRGRVGRLLPSRASTGSSSVRFALDPERFARIARAQAVARKAGAMRIAVGADHLGLPLKDSVKAPSRGRPRVVDSGSTRPTPSTTPTWRSRSRGGRRGSFERAILVCGTGIGMAITANKVPGVRAANVADPYSAERAREVERRPGALPRFAGGGAGGGRPRRPLAGVRVPGR